MFRTRHVDVYGVVSQPWRNQSPDDLNQICDRSAVMVHISPTLVTLNLCLFGRLCFFCRLAFICCATAGLQVLMVQHLETLSAGCCWALKGDEDLGDKEGDGSVHIPDLHVLTVRDGGCCSQPWNSNAKFLFCSPDLFRLVLSFLWVWLMQNSGFKLWFCLVRARNV